MSYVVTNLKDVDVFLSSKFLISSKGTEGRFKRWLSNVLKKESVVRRDWLTPSSITTSDDEHVRRAIENGEDVFEITFCDAMTNEIRHVTDWLAELEQRDPRLFSKLDRITWKQAVEHSNRWHEALARKAEKEKERNIKFDENCPIVLEMEGGYRWVWLKTSKARDDEGRLMGHCVGNGGYEATNAKMGIFSLRDENGHPVVTMEYKEGNIKQKKAKSNKDVPRKYEEMIRKFDDYMKPLMGLERKKSGRDHLTYWNGDQAWYSDGRLHREDGPAVKLASGEEYWFKDGVLHRDGGPAIKSLSSAEKWYKNGHLHREDGPAVKFDSGLEKWYLDGVLHRDDGPAVRMPNGMLQWCVKGRYLSEEEFQEIKRVEII